MELGDFLANISSLSFQGKRIRRRPEKTAAPAANHLTGVMWKECPDNSPSTNQCRKIKV
jgi:hypothetical protein